MNIYNNPMQQGPLQQMNSQFYAPRYGQPQMPYIPPQQPMPQNQMPQQGFRGRVVEDIEEVVANEVPMDGTVSFFPKSDYSCIYAKIWGGDGKISTFKFVPEKQPDPKAEAAKDDDISELINKRFDDIEKLLKQHNRPYKKNYNEKYKSYKKPYNEPKKEGTENG